MAWHARYGEGDASGVPPRYASTARAGSAIGSAYFMREDDRRRGSSHARPDPTGHVIAKQARRAFEASRGEDEVGESVRYVRSLRYLPRERGEDVSVVSGEAKMSPSSPANHHHHPSSNEPSDSSNSSRAAEMPGGHRGVPSFGFGYPTGDGGVGAFEFPATRSVMWDPSAIDATTHISAAAHVATASLGADASKSLAELLLRAETEPGKKASPAVEECDVSAKGAFVASRRVLDRRGEFCASAALEIFAVGDAAEDAATETALPTESDGGLPSEAWSSSIALAIVSAPPGQTREALEAMTSFPSKQDDERILEETLEDKRRVSALAPLRVATPWRARLAATVVKKSVTRGPDSSGVELMVSARLRVPTAVFAATPIAPPRVADSPLLIALVAAQTRAPRAPITSGFLTMDRTRRLMLLDETEPSLSELPTVGVWVSGVTHTTHLAVWAACFRYKNGDGIKDKATQRGAFLCLVFPPADGEEEAGSQKARAPPPTCHDVRLVEPRSGASRPRTHADFAATFKCVPGETASRFRLAPPPAIRAERNADAMDVSRDEAEASGDAARVTLRRRGDSRGDGAPPDAAHPVERASLSLSTPRRDSAQEREAETKRKSASPDWAPIYGTAPRTAYEAAAAAAAARAAAANAKLAASRGATPSSLLSPATLSPIKPHQPHQASVSSSFPLEGAARVVVEEQQRVIAELRAAVAFLETEMAQLTRPISAREREAQARDLLGGLEGATGFEPSSGEAEDASLDGDESTNRGDERKGDGAFAGPSAASPSPSSKSPLRKALAFARGGEATETDAALEETSFRSDEVDAMYGMDTPPGSGDERAAAKEKKASKKAAREERRAARREKKAKKKKSGGNGDESLVEKADEDNEEEDFQEEEAEDVQEASTKKDVDAAAEEASARALAHREKATVSFAKTRSQFPAAPDGIPPDVPEPPNSLIPAQPNRRFCESPYVESVEEAEEKGERVADPLPGGGARYPAEPHLAHAATGFEFADDGGEKSGAEKSEGSDTETDALLNASSLMVDPEAMDEETAARLGASQRRDAAFQLELSGDGAESSEGLTQTPPVAFDKESASKSNARRLAVRAGLDPMYPVIDCSFEDEGADDEDERVEELLEKYGGDAGENGV